MKSGNRIDRHEFLKLVASGVIAAAIPRSALARRRPRETCTYKIADRCEIKADVYQSAPDAAKPAVMWIHGGALIMGSRKSPDASFQAELVKRGFVVVSIDYRLAPESKLPDIIADVKDAWRWLRGTAASGSASIPTGSPWRAGRPAVI